jgi:hypothetical protein
MADLIKKYPTVEQIAEWKNKYKRVQEFTYTDENGKEFKAWIRKPNFTELGLATTNAKKNPMNFSKTIIQTCWLAGDEEIKENEDALLSISDELENLIKAGHTSVKIL